MRYQDHLDQPALQTYAHALNARAKSAGAKGVLAWRTLYSIILESGGACGWCGESVVNRDFELDHIISLNAGGAHIAENLAVTCPACNRRKSHKSPAQFAQEIYQETGKLTPLIQRVLDHYGLDTPPQQPSLF